MLDSPQAFGLHPNADITSVARWPRPPAAARFHRSSFLREEVTRKLLPWKLARTVISGVRYSVYLWMCGYVSVCVCVLSVKGKRLELSTPNLVHVYGGYSMAGIDPEVRRSQDYEVCCRRGSACRYDCSGFYSFPDVCISCNLRCGSFHSADSAVYVVRFLAENYSVNITFWQIFSHYPDRR